MGNFNNIHGWNKDRDQERRRLAIDVLKKNKNLLAAQVKVILK